MCMLCVLFVKSYSKQLNNKTYQHYLTYNMYYYTRTIKLMNKRLYMHLYKSNTFGVTPHLNYFLLCHC